MTKTLVLWDIDFTLIESGGVGAVIYADAFRAVTGRALGVVPLMAGRTEPAIFRDAFVSNNADGDPEEAYGRFAGELERGYARRAGELRTGGRTLPGAENALRMLGGRDDVLQSVLTGNTRASALIKLVAFGLDAYVDLDIGAYGSDHEIRASLVPIARRRAAAVRGIAFEPADTVLIGDTPHDIGAARASGARVIAVATGIYSAGDLASAHPDAVLTDLTHTDALLTAIDGTSPRQGVR